VTKNVTQRKSGYEYLSKSLDEARAQNMSDERIIQVLANAAKESPEAMEALTKAYRQAVEENTTDLSAAIEKSIQRVGGARGMAHLFGGSR
jgi:hypothetical protein